MSVTFEKAPTGEPVEPAEDQAAVEVAPAGDVPGAEEGQEPAHQQEMEEPEESGLRGRLPSREQVGERMKAGVGTVRSWIMTEEISEEDLLVRVAERQQADRERAEQELRHQVDRLHQRVVEAEAQAAREASEHGQAGTAGAARRASANVRAELAQVEAQLRRRVEQNQAAALPPSARDVKRARRAKQLQRGCAVVGAVVVGGVLLPIHAPLITPVVMLAAAAALWKLGARPQEQPEQAPVTVAGTGSGRTVLPWQQHGPRPTSGPEVVGAAVEGVPVDLVEHVKMHDERLAQIVGGDAATSQDVAAMTPAQLDAATTVIEALFKAGAITASERAETHVVGPILPKGPGWEAVVDLPRGKAASEAVSKLEKIASALRVDEQQVQMTIERGAVGSHSGRLRLWVADEPNPFRGERASVLIRAQEWDLWNDGVPLGLDARGIEALLRLMWQSWMLGGNPGQGKSFMARLAVAAAALDPTVRLHIVTGKRGPDWDAAEHVAHSSVQGNSMKDVWAVYRLLTDLLVRIQAKGDELSRLHREDPKSCPKGKLTKELSRRKGLELDLLMVDELQELLDAAAEYDIVEVDGEEIIRRKGGRGDGNAKDAIVSRLSRHIRVGRFVASLTVLLTQRPDADSIPSKLRGVASIRSCHQVTDREAAVMVLTNSMVSAGAAPHLIPPFGWEGVSVINLGEHSPHTTLKVDTIELPDFLAICLRGRDLRQANGTLTGFAAQHLARAEERAQKAEAEQQARHGATLILRDTIAVMEAADVDMARTETLAKLLAEHNELRYLGITASQVAERLRKAGAGSTVRLGAFDGLANASGYRLETIREALPD